jgi:hypothetical protein
MKWITRAHIHVDRVACPWLIKRFIDSEASFMFVAEDLVREEAERTGAIPFDVKGADLGHKGDDCSFRAFIRKYHLKDPALALLSDIINAADTDKFDANPYARGVEAMAQGFSLLFPDDHENLEAQFLVYDALFAFCRLKTAAAANPGFVKAGP